MAAATNRAVFCFCGSLTDNPLSEFANANYMENWITGIIAKQGDNAYFLACMSKNTKKALIAQGDSNNKTKFNTFIILS